MQTRVSSMALPKHSDMIEKTEPILMLLAIASVVGYLCELRGLWADHEEVYTAIMMIIDICFVLDLGLKIALQRGQYLRSPWFVIDLLSSVPALGTVLYIHGFDPALRAIRGLRFLRSLRGLRSVRLLADLRLGANITNTKEMRLYHQVLSVTVVAFSLLCISLLRWIHASASADMANQYEFFLVLGIILGILLLLIVFRFQLPAFSMGQIHQLLNIALPKQMVHHFMKDPSVYHKTVRMPATIVFSDIQGFTSSVERLGDDLQALKKNLEQAMGAIVKCHIKHDLIVDKYIGDAVMSFRGGNLVEGSPEENAYRVVRASIESLQAIRALNNPYFNHVRIGGASSEQSLIGAFGTPERLSYTILGDRVNLAARLESLCKQSGTDNLFCEKTMQLTQNRSDILWRRYERCSIRGKVESVMLYEALDHDGGEAPKWLTLYHQALEAFEHAQFQEAAKLFAAASAAREGGDQPSVRYQQRCETMSEQNRAAE